MKTSRWLYRRLWKGLIALAVTMVPVILLGLIQTGCREKFSQAKKTTARYTVVIDPGHGGYDCGKLGVGDIEEKDINLQISLILAGILRQNDCQVIMTRKDDTAPFTEGMEQSKTSELRERCRIIDGSRADVAVSIHQNSYPSQQVHGAQVFYAQGSEQGRKLAEQMQTQLRQHLDPENLRQAKANPSYYILTHTKTPTVIAECGFLSQAEEASRLAQPVYQRRVAWAVAMAVLQYLGEEELEEGQT